jgi:DhnA family fructose-bisphosphate aldolase class Ia
MAEMQPGGFDAGPNFFTTENVAISARIAAELGADWVKIPYTPEFNRVVERCYVPVVILGGAKANQDQAILAAAQGAIDAGAAGIAVGRNIFQAEDPAAATRALANVVHPGIVLSANTEK